MRMRVLHYVDDNVLSWGKPYVQLLGALRELGCENVAVCRPGGTLAGLLEGEGVEVHTYRPIFASVPEFARGFRKIIDTVKPNIIHTRLSSAANIGGVWGKKLNIPVLSTVDKFPKRKYYENAALILPCSTPVYEYMLSQGVPPEKMQLIPNAVDVKAYARDNSVRNHIRETEGLTDGTICFLGMGRLIDWKGFDDLLRGFAEFMRECEEPDRFVLWLAGDGQERESLHKLAHTLEISERVKFWGFVDDVKPVLWGADIYIHPSWGDEAFGLSLLEAMSAGLPAIASESGGMTEILRDDCGLPFPRRDITALVHCMRECITKADSLSSAALSRAKDFDISTIAAKTFSLYKNVFATPHG
ncbi:MAG: glycosyltransferase family 4 protein [Synergistaceae bacterium]|nr:glycosyltransferase family 4 protein [Synergistaceae bacterium]